MIVAVPSKGRAGQSRTVDLLGSRATLFVPEIEADSYRACYPGHTVVDVPMSVRGITATRNWILDNAGDEHVVMIDDDVRLHGWTELRDETSRKQSLTANEWVDEWAKLFSVTESMGYRIWGVATDGATRAIYPWKPFLWRSYITASCMGIINDGRTRFDESFPVKEDYELTLRCLVEDGGVVAARYLYWVNQHWGGRGGGCVDYRTQQMEADAIRRLQRKYPGMVRQVHRGGSRFSIELIV